VILVKRGAHVTIVARDPTRLIQAEQELKVRPSVILISKCLHSNIKSIAKPGQIIQSIPADLTQSKTSTEALEKSSIAHGGRCPDHVYLCAGFSKPKFMVDSTEEEFKGVSIQPLFRLLLVWSSSLIRSLTWCTNWWFSCNR
jgi:3-dehydrosphinganine reductase